MFGLKYVTGSGEGLLQSFDDISSDEVLYASFGVHGRFRTFDPSFIELWHPKVGSIKGHPEA